MADKVIKAGKAYRVAAKCAKCGTPLPVKVFDGMPPRGHDDNLVYQEIALLGIQHCPNCTVIETEGVAN